MEHSPVLVQAVVDALQCRANQGGIYVDGTVGDGGHTRAILEATGPEGRVIALDRDAEALEAATERLRDFSHRVRFVQANFAALPAVLSELGVPSVHGIMLDLGVSTRQLESANRGFSFQRNGPLDMRMDVQEPTTAAELIARASLVRLTAILQEYGEERWAGRIARAIVEERRRRPIKTTGHLTQLISQVVPSSSRLHPATRTFLALRIAVNQELDWLARGLEAVAETLRAGGRLCVIAFHSLEDRLVKQAFRRWATGQRPMVQLVTRRPIRPAADEVARNPRARSARLRVIERLA